MEGGFAVFQFGGGGIKFLERRGFSHFQLNRSLLNVFEDGPVYCRGQASLRSVPSYMAVISSFDLLRSTPFFGLSGALI